MFGAIIVKLYKYLSHFMKQIYQYKLKPTFGEVFTASFVRHIEKPVKYFVLVILSLTSAVVLKVLIIPSLEALPAIIVITISNALLIYSVLYVLSIVGVLLVTFVQCLAHRKLLTEEFTLNFYAEKLEAVRGEAKTEIKYSAVTKVRFAGDYLFYKHKYSAGQYGYFMLAQFPNRDEFVKFFMEKIKDNVLH